MAFSMEDMIRGGYNRASPDMRETMIMKRPGNDVTAGVARVMSKRDYDTVQGFRDVGNTAQARVGGDATFTANWARLETLIKTNGTVAEQMMERYDNNSHGYQSTIRSLAQKFDKNPAFAQIMLKDLEANPAKAGATFDRYQEEFQSRRIDQYVADVTRTGRMDPVAAAAPAAPAPQLNATTTTAATSTPQAKPPKPAKGERADHRAAQLERMQRLAETDREAGKPAPAVSATTAPATAAAKPTAAQITEVTPEAAAKLYAEYADSKDPTHVALMEQIRKNGLEGDIAGILKKRPDQVNTLYDNDVALSYTKMLAGGKKGEFLKDFGGEAAKQPGMENQFKDLMDKMKAEGGMMGSLASFAEKGFREFRGQFASFRSGLQGSGQTVATMMNDKSNPHYQGAAGEIWLAQLARRAERNAISGDPLLAANGKRMLNELGADGGDVGGIMRDRAMVSHVRIEAQVDPKTKKHIAWKPVLDVEAITPEALVARQAIRADVKAAQAEAAAKVEVAKRDPNLSGATNIVSAPTQPAPEPRLTVTEG